MKHVGVSVSVGVHIGVHAWVRGANNSNNILSGRAIILPIEENNTTVVADTLVHHRPALSAARDTRTFPHHTQDLEPLRKQSAWPAPRTSDWWWEYYLHGMNIRVLLKEMIIAAISTARLAPKSGFKF